MCLCAVCVCLCTVCVRSRARVGTHNSALTSVCPRKKNSTPSGHCIPSAVTICSYDSGCVRDRDAVNGMQMATATLKTQERDGAAGFRAPKCDTYSWAGMCLQRTRICVAVQASRTLRIPQQLPAISRRRGLRRTPDAPMQLKAGAGHVGYEPAVCAGPTFKPCTFGR